MGKDFFGPTACGSTRVFLFLSCGRSARRFLGCIPVGRTIGRQRRRAPPILTQRDLRTGRLCRRRSWHAMHAGFTLLTRVSPTADAVPGGYGWGKASEGTQGPRLEPHIGKLRPSVYLNTKVGKPLVFKLNTKVGKPACVQEIRHPILVVPSLG